MPDDSGDPAFESLIRYIQDSRGFDFRGYKRSSLRRRIALRMEQVSADSFAAYNAFLEADPHEFDGLLNTILIKVTSFFRDAEAWEALKLEVLPKLLASDGGATRSGSGASAAPPARSPIHWPCCSPRRWAPRSSPGG